MKNYSLILLLFSIVVLSESAFAGTSSNVKPKDVSVLIYYSGDNRLSEFMHSSYLRVLREGAGPNVNVVVQYDGQEKNDSFRVSIGDTKVGDTYKQTFYARNIEYDMGNTKTLADFVKWGKTNFPAKRTMLVISSHGFGILNNPYPVYEEPKSKISNLASSIDDSSKSFMAEEAMVRDLKQVLGDEKLDLLVHNSCLMGSLEALSVMASVAKYAIASEYSIYMDTMDDLVSDVARTILIERIVKQLKQDSAVSEKDIGHKVVTDFKELYKSFQMPTTDSDQIIRYPSTLAFYDLGLIHSLALEYSRIGKEFMRLAQSDASAFARLFDENLKALYVDSFGYVDLRTLYYGLAKAIYPKDFKNVTDKFDQLANKVVPEKTELYTNQVYPVSHLHVFFPSFMTQADLKPFRKSYSEIKTVQYYGWPQFLDFTWKGYESYGHSYWMTKLKAWNNGANIKVKPTSIPASYDDDFFLQMYMVAYKLSQEPGHEKLKVYNDFLKTLTRSSPLLERHRTDVANLLK